MAELQTNLVYCGHNLDMLRRCVPGARVDLIYLDPPLNSDRDSEVLR